MSTESPACNKGKFKVGDVVTLTKECVTTGSMGCIRAAASSTFWRITHVNRDVGDDFDGLFIVPCTREGIQTGDLDFGGWMLDSGEVELAFTHVIPPPSKAPLTVEDVKAHWMGKRIAYTRAAFEKTGSWTEESPEQTEVILASTYKVIEVDDVGTWAAQHGVKGVPFIEDCYMRVEVVTSPKGSGHLGTWAAYGWEAVILP